MRGSGEAATTYLLLGMLTMVMAAGDGGVLLMVRGLLEMGMDEPRLLLPSMDDMLRQLWTESGRDRLKSFLVMDVGPLERL